MGESSVDTGESHIFFLQRLIQIFRLITPVPVPPNRRRNIHSGCIIELQKILQSLLRERVPIRDMETILETLADWGTKTKDLDVLTEYVRNGLRRTICAIYAAPNTQGQLTLVCTTLDPGLEDQINAYIDRGAQGTSLNMPAAVARQIASEISTHLAAVTARGRLPVVIASPQVRSAVWQIVEPYVPAVAILGYNEVVAGIEVESVGLVGPIGENKQSGSFQKVPVGA